MKYQAWLTDKNVNKIKKLIEQNMEKFNNNDFDFFYGECLKYSYPTSMALARTLTILLINTGIDFLNYMKYIYDYSFDSLPIEELIVPYGVEGLGHYVFDHCKELNKVVLPNSLKAVADNIFVRCSKLKEITFLGTKEEWEKLMKKRLQPYQKSVGYEIVAREPKVMINWASYTIKCSDGDYKFPTRITL